MDTAFLEECGLTKGESMVYMALAELGSSTAGPIIKKTSLQRSAVYFCLEMLVKKGLASFISKNNKKYYEAENPEKLNALVDSKIKRLNDSKSSLLSFVKEAEAKRKTPKDEAKVFRGWNGMESAFDDILKTLKKGDGLYVFGVITSDDVFSRFRRFLGKFNQKRLEIGFKFNVIMNAKLKDTLGLDREKEKGAFVKYLPAEFHTPAVTYVYDSKVMLIIWKEEPVAFVMESRDTAKSYRHYFDVLWKIAKSRKELA